MFLDVLVFIEVPSAGPCSPGAKAEGEGEDTRSRREIASLRKCSMSWYAVFATSATTGVATCAAFDSTSDAVAAAFTRGGGGGGSATVMVMVAVSFCASSLEVSSRAAATLCSPALAFHATDTRALVP